MGNKITNDMVKYAYETGKKVYQGKITLSEGKFEIARKTNMDVGSANDYINVLKSMLDGMEYHRTINTYATEYYLDNIKKDFGEAALKKALFAAKMHTEYYETLGHGRLASIEELIKRY